MLKVGMYFRSGRFIDESVRLKFVNRFEKSDRDDEAAGGSSTSISSSSLRSCSVDPRAELPFSERKSRLDLADSTVGGLYPRKGRWLRSAAESFCMRPCLSASSLTSRGPNRDCEEEGREEVASSYVGIGRCSYRAFWSPIAADGPFLAPCGEKDNLTRETRGTVTAPPSRGSWSCYASQMGVYIYQTSVAWLDIFLRAMFCWLMSGKSSLLVDVSSLSFPLVRAQPYHVAVLI